MKKWIVPIGETQAEITAGVHPLEEGSTVTVDLIFRQPFGSMTPTEACNLGLMLVEAAREGGELTAKLRGRGAYVDAPTRIAHGPVMDAWRCARCTKLLSYDPVSMGDPLCTGCGGAAELATVEDIPSETVANLTAARDPKAKPTKASRRAAPKRKASAPPPWEDEK